MLDQLHAAELLFRYEARERDQRLAIRRSMAERAAHLESTAAALEPAPRPAPRPVAVPVAVPVHAARRESVRPAWPRHITERTGVSRTPVLTAGGSIRR